MSRVASIRYLKVYNIVWRDSDRTDLPSEVVVDMADDLGLSDLVDSSVFYDDEGTVYLFDALHDYLDEKYGSNVIRFEFEGSEQNA